MPFHALPLRLDGDETRFLIERNLVSYVRSATDLVKQRTRPPQPLRSALAVAPTPDALPHTKREISHVQAASFEQVRSLVGEAARAEAVRQAWADYDVVHVAAHARTNEQFPLYSPLKLKGGHIELCEILQQSDRRRNGAPSPIRMVGGSFHLRPSMFILCPRSISPHQSVSRSCPCRW